MQSELNGKGIEWVNICAPILTLNRLVAGVPGRSSHNSSMSVSCEETGDAEGGEDMGSVATHSQITSTPYV